VTVEPVAAKKPMTQEEWRGWVASMAGTWQGDFERIPQGNYEERDFPGASCHIDENET